jgi:hypothetical protein
MRYVNHGQITVGAEVAATLVHDVEVNGLQIYVAHIRSDNGKLMHDRVTSNSKFTAEVEATSRGVHHGDFYCVAVSTVTHNQPPLLT